MRKAVRFIGVKWRDLCRLRWHVPWGLGEGHSSGLRVCACQSKPCDFGSAVADHQDIVAGEVSVDDAV